MGDELNGPTTDAEALPPQDLHAEQAVLGSMLLEPGAAERALAKLEADDFYREAHQLIFGAMERVVKRNEPVDIVTVCNELRKYNLLDQVGSSVYLDACIHETPTAAHVLRYAGIVKESRVLRDLIGLGDEAKDVVHKRDSLWNGKSAAGCVRWVEDRLGEVKRRLASIARKVQPGINVGEYYDWLCARIDGHKPVRGARTGLKALDHWITGGWEPPCLVVVAAEPKIGKSSLLLQSAIATAEAGIPAAFLSYEGDLKHDVFRKAMAQFSGVDMWRAQTHGLDQAHEDAQRAALANAAEQLRRLQDDRKLILRDLQGQGAMAMSAELINCKDEYGIEFAAVDYFQEVEGGTDVGVYQDLVAQMKHESVQHNIVLLTASQVTRQSDGTSSTFWTKKLEHAPHCVLRLEKLKDPGLVPPGESYSALSAQRQKANRQRSRFGLIIVDLNRRGPGGHAKVRWAEGHQMFFDVEEYEQLYGSTEPDERTADQTH